MRVLSRLHGRTAAGVPRWAVLAAWVTAFTVLPSGVWRIAFTAGAPLLQPIDGPPPGHGPVVFDGWGYVIVLTLLSEALAVLAVGLVSTWGERVPRWIPWLGGRRIPVAAAAIPAGLGATVLTLLWPYALLMVALGKMVNGTGDHGAFTEGWQTPVFFAAYGPLALWGPLLGLLTVHYARRRRVGDAVSGRAR